MKRLLILIFLLLATPLQAQDRAGQIREHLLDAQSERILIVAHRGAWRLAPENSIAAISEAVRINADIVEIDVQRTRDGELVLMHDETLERTTNGRGRVDGYTLEELRELRLKDAKGNLSEHAIPTLEEAMLAARGEIMVNLDKADRFMDQAMAVLEATATVDHVILKGSYSPQETLNKIKDLHPELIYMPVITLGFDIYPSDEYLMEYVDLINPAAIEVNFFMPHFRAVQPEFIEELRSLGVRVWANTLWPEQNAFHSDPFCPYFTRSWDWIVDRGFSIIQSDRPVWLNDYLIEKHDRRVLE